jgi:hypothetical protein
MHPRPLHRPWSVALAGILSLGVAGAAAPQGPEPDVAAARARVIARALEAGKLEEARIEAEAGVKQWPERAVLRTRLAEVRLCQALSGEGGVGEALRDFRFSTTLATVVPMLQEPDTLFAHAQGLNPQRLELAMAR